ncbi:hypothetical protein BCR41DRAFT_371653 [Lobosporangium transversale]|uniref:Uncharacterized protein n=1 Tax=Lobosporangium transversale TaxID=64571 RepID=A0A1Y2GJQ3_9FUNG|nr:hypothetical protein BCR41DRAFT_371653 [Lobosporangium transversale]ORZ12959.1 hypothetical protein BCR41DRAFT_371653 [Lobosporangium transversale]|eukprot:XP_021880308.1 hypothetical protein BCR41DRAFT_371653 [Lobosporangium transversale]
MDGDAPAGPEESAPDEPKSVKARGGRLSSLTDRLRARPPIRLIPLIPVFAFKPRSDPSPSTHDPQTGLLLATSFEVHDLSLRECLQGLMKDNCRFPVVAFLLLIHLLASDLVVGDLSGDWIDPTSTLRVPETRVGEDGREGCCRDLVAKECMLGESCGECIGELAPFGNREDDRGGMTGVVAVVLTVSNSGCGAGGDDMTCRRLAAMV